MTYLVREKPSDQGSTGRRVISVGLGIAATLTSLSITVIAGIERGATVAEKSVWVSTGVVILLAAHLLPALTKGARVLVKGMVLPIWLGALLATGYTHATFFLNAQGRVAEERASAVGAAVAASTAAPAPNSRSRTQIAADVAAATRNLAFLDSRRCSDDCGAIVARRKVFVSRLAALKIEDDEAVRAERASDARMAALDRREKAQDAARVDPFVANLSNFLRLGAGQVNLLIAILLGWLVDAVAVVSWAAVARTQRRPNTLHTATEPVPAAPPTTSYDVTPAQIAARGVAANEPQLCSAAVASPVPPVELSPVTRPSLVAAAPNDHRVAEQREAQVERDEVFELADLAEAIRAGRAKATLPSIRSYLDCEDGMAMAFRRRLAEEYPDLFWPAARVG